MAKQSRDYKFAAPDEGVKMPQSEDDALFGDDSPVEALPPAEHEDPMRNWHAVPEPPEVGGRYGAPPYDHALVLLTLDGEQSVVAQWQASRRWAGTGAGKRWEAYGFWAQRNTGGKPVAFEPKGWREWRG